MLVTNIPVPYRLPALQRVASRDNIEFHVCYCASSNVDATLGESAHGFPTHWLGGRYRTHDRRFMHSDPGVVRMLADIRPDVVITAGYIPTFLFAFAWARWNRIPHVVITDGTVASERTLTAVHRWVRKYVWARSKAFAGACEGSLDLFRAQGIDPELLFKVPLAVDNARFDLPGVPEPEKVDLLFCGRLVPHKGPAFALEVAVAVARRLGRRVTLDFVGAGPEEAALRQRSASNADFVEVRFLGYQSQEALPHRYAAARLFLFPSQWDPWGVVANEACASGLPVLVSPHAGAANELVIDGDNGRVLPLDVDVWADVAAELLRTRTTRERMGVRSKEIVQHFNFDSAAAGIVSAIELAAIERDH